MNLSIASLVIAARNAKDPRPVLHAARPTVWLLQLVPNMKRLVTGRQGRLLPNCACELCLLLQQTEGNSQDNACIGRSDPIVHHPSASDPINGQIKTIYMKSLSLEIRYKSENIFFLKSFQG